jgi:hypothetical protein
LKHNGERLKKITAEGNDLKTKIPSKEQSIDEKINELQNYWDSLKKACMDREKKLFECSKAEILSKNVNELANFAGEHEDKITNKPFSSEDLDNLANIKRLLKDQDHDEAAMNFRKQELDNIAKSLAKELTGEDLKDMEDQVEKLRKRFDELEGPMSDRRKQLEAAKKIHELKRDILIELRWINEKLASAENSNYGESLHAAQLLQARHNTLKAEVLSHQNRINELLSDTDIEDQKELSEKWHELLSAIDNREEKLKLSVIAQQYLFDAEEVQDWIGERELYLLGTESQKSDNEDIATRNIRRHAQHQQAINDYEPKIQELSVEANKIKDSNNPDAETCEAKQQAIESAFNSLKQLAKDRGIVLADNAERLKLSSEFNDFSNWIGDREKIANSNDTGKNASDCDRLIAKNNLWADETKTTGNEKL